MGMEDDASCDFCGEVQSAIYILTECPGLVGYRIAILGKPVVNIEDIRKYSIDRILRLARETEFWDY